MKLTAHVPRLFCQAVCVAVLLSAGGSGVSAQSSPTAQRGLNLAMANCSRCHAVDKLSPSPLALAPPFRDLHLRYPVENLAEALGEGIVTGHQNMPEFRLDPGQVSDFIDFLKALEL
jgi:mono/diheme cytochrome c family protein